MVVGGEGPRVVSAVGAGCSWACENEGQQPGTHLCFEGLFLRLNVCEDLGHAGLQHHASHHNLVENVVDLR